MGFWIKGQEGRWIRLHPKALAVMGTPKSSGQIFDRRETLDAFRESVYKKAKHEKIMAALVHSHRQAAPTPQEATLASISGERLSHYVHRKKSLTVRVSEAGQEQPLELPAGAVALLMHPSSDGCGSRRHDHTRERRINNCGSREHS